MKIKLSNLIENFEEFISRLPEGELKKDLIRGYETKNINLVLNIISEKFEEIKNYFNYEQFDLKNISESFKNRKIKNLIIEKFYKDYGWYFFPYMENPNLGFNEKQLKIAKKTFFEIHYNSNEIPYKGKIFHLTSVKNYNEIKKEGFVLNYNYFFCYPENEDNLGINEKLLRVSINIENIENRLYPDPEFLLSAKIQNIRSYKGFSINYDTLYCIWFEENFGTDYNQIINYQEKNKDCAWLVVVGKIAPNLLMFEKL